MDVYFLALLVFNAVQVRTLRLPDKSHMANLLPVKFSAAIVIKTSALFLEAAEKAKLFAPE